MHTAIPARALTRYDHLEKPYSNLADLPDWQKIVAIKLSNLPITHSGDAATIQALYRAGFKIVLVQDEPHYSQSLTAKLSALGVPTCGCGISRPVVCGAAAFPAHTPAAQVVGDSVRVRSYYFDWLLGVQVLPPYAYTRASRALPVSAATVAAAAASALAVSEGYCQLILIRDNSNSCTEEAAAKHAGGRRTDIVITSSGQLRAAVLRQPTAGFIMNNTNHAVSFYANAHG